MKTEKQELEWNGLGATWNCSGKRSNGNGVILYTVPVGHPPLSPHYQFHLCLLWLTGDYQTPITK